MALNIPWHQFHESTPYTSMHLLLKNGNKKLLRIEVLKIALLKIVVWVSVLDWVIGNEKWKC